jgi:hypothetical protein
MSIFELIMLICFGLAWPFSIYRSFKSGKNEGKSPIFLAIIAFGYLSGIIHKFLYLFDYVIYLYIINFIMVCIDLGLYYRNLKYKA